METIESYWKWNTEALAMIANMKATPQSEIHHAEGDVYVHTQMVIDEIKKSYSKYPTNSQNNLVLAACLHDIAKPLVTIWDEGDWKSPGHAKLGEKLVRQLLWNDTYFEDRENIASIVRYHGLPIWFTDKDDPDMSIIGASLRCSIEELSLFAECDFRGRICKDVEDNLFKIEFFKERAQELGCFDKPYQFTSDWARLHYFKNGEYPGKEIWEPYGAWFVLMVGLPGSGKNHWLKKNWSGRVIELDTIRKKHKIRATDKDAQGFVANIAKEELRESLRKKEDVVWNATNITEQQRSSLIDIALQYKAKIKIVYIDCSEDQAIKNNREREEKSQIPTIAISKLFKKIEMPTIRECHELIIVK